MYLWIKFTHPYSLRFASLHFTTEKSGTFAVSAVDCGIYRGPCAAIQTNATIGGERIFTACRTSAAGWAHAAIYCVY